MNVWVALTYRAHKHYISAQRWLSSLSDDSELCFCRMSQLGFLRLLTTEAVMGDRVLSQAAAWDTYDNWLENGRTVFVEEPSSVEQVFRSISRSRQSSPKDWADSYFSAFARASGMTLVTFDQTLQRRTTGSILLSP